MKTVLSYVENNHVHVKRLPETKIFYDPCIVKEATKENEFLKCIQAVTDVRFAIWSHWCTFIKKTAKCFIGYIVYS